MSDERDLDVGSQPTAYDQTMLSDASLELVPPPVKVADDTLPPGPEPVTFIGSDDAQTLTSPEAPFASRPGEVRIGQVLAGKYELIRLLGQGGMGKVFLGEHRGLGIPVAVKTLHPEIVASSDYVRRFQHEAHAASLLNHPNVVHVYDFGTDNGTLYLVMEFLQGRSLASWLNQLMDPPPLVEVVEIMSQLLDAFSVAHAYGIVHRDLKPDNVYLTEMAGKRLVKVLDFGLAHVDDKRDQGPTLTAKNVVAGTPAYMSPEQCRSLVVGPSADIYSLGCVLTEMLQLRPPFSGNSAIEMLANQMFSPPPPLARPSQAEPVPPLLERLRLDLLAKVPEKRPRTPAEVKARLLEAMSREATLARLPTRKGDEPLGDRAARAPAWGPAKAAPAADRIQTRRAGLMRLVEEASGVTHECETGLAAHQVELVAVTRGMDLTGLDLGVLVVDAGGRVDEARGLLAGLQKTAPGLRAVVCAAHLDTERMNALVSAGAADVVRYPVTPDALARKIERVLRRGR